MAQPLRRTPIASWLLPNTTAFAASFCIMLMELVGGRIVSTHLGMSLYTWTSLIGVVMAGMSCGHFVGGWLADRAPLRRGLAVAFLAAGLACTAILPLNDLLGNAGLLRGSTWPLRITLHVTGAFFLPALLLGLIVPLVARLALAAQSREGRAVGGVFASSVAGSIAGTFATGYYLTAALGASTILMIASAGLATLGLLYLIASLRADAAFPVRPGESDSARPALWREWLPPILTVVCSNLAFMVFELAAMRVMSREFGGTLYTWTAVLGTVLAGISLGNALGGRLADRNASATVIARVFACAGMLMLLSPAVSAWMTDAREGWPLFAARSWPMQITLHAIAAFFLPNVFIGMVSPLVVKRVLDRGHAAGGTVGAVYAWGALGAIAGTFLAGYGLIPGLGSLPVIAVTALVLGLAAWLYRPFGAMSVATLTAAVACATLALGVPPGSAPIAQRLHLQHEPLEHAIYEDESAYSYIAVTEHPEDPNRREMILDRVPNTEVDLTRPTALYYEYAWIYQAAIDSLIPIGQPVDCLVIGGGGYSFPRYLDTVRPGSRILVAEIDPAVTRAAREAMGLEDSPDIRVFHQDARHLVADLRRQQDLGYRFEPFDMVLGDSFTDFSVPSHLTTLEFLQDIERLLSDEGVYMLNLIDMYSEGGFLAAMTHTSRQVFPHVYVFDTGRPKRIYDTFVLIGSKAPLDVEPLPDELLARYGYVGNLLTDAQLDKLIEKHDHLLLTDDFAPVENLLAPVVRDRTGDYGQLALEYARQYGSKRQWRTALLHVEQAVQLRPELADAHEYLGVVHEHLGNLSQAIAAYERALELTDEPARMHYILGLALLRADKPAEAAESWRRTVDLEPGHAPAWYSLGMLHRERGHLRKAIASWERVLEIEPTHIDAGYHLVIAYDQVGDKEKARELSRRMQQHDLSVPPTLE